MHPPSRSTHEKLNLDDWVTQQRRRKWRWVARLANTEADAWTTQALRWDPTLDTQHNTRRRQGRPKTRWTDDIYNYVRRTTQDSTADTHDQSDDNNSIAADATNILQMAQNKELWLAMEGSFVTRT